MKKGIRFAGIITSLLAITAGISFTLNNKVSVADAKDAPTYDDLFTIGFGLYHRITDPSSMVGKKVIIIGDNGYTMFREWSGNGYEWIWSEPITKLSANKEYAYLDHKYCLELTVEEHVVSETTYYRFKADEVITGVWQQEKGYYAETKKNEYLTWVNGIKYHREVGFESSSNASDWSLTYDGTNMRAVNRQVDKLLTYAGDDFGIVNNASQHKSTINFYEYIGEIDWSYDPTQSSPRPYQTQYRKQDTLNLSGFAPIFYLENCPAGYLTYVELSYDIAPNFYSFDSSINYSDEELAEHGYSNKPRQISFFTHSLVFTIYIDIVETYSYTFTKVTDKSTDQRGTYLVVAENAGKVFRCSDHGVGDIYINNNKISDPSGTLFNEYSIKLTIEMEHDSYGDYHYYAKTNSFSYYIRYDSTEPDFMFYSGGTKATVTLYSANGDLVIADPYSSDTYAMRYDGTKFLLSNNTSYEAAVLYRVDTHSTTIAIADDFRTGYFDNEIRDLCYMDGNTPQANINTIISNWSSIKTTLYSGWFGNNPDLWGYLARMTYFHNDHPQNTNESMIDCYDYLVSKYGLDDFLFRKEAGTYIDQNQQAKMFESIIKTTDITTIVIVSVVGSLTLIATAFYFKKKKEMR